MAQGKAGDGSITAAIFNQLHDRVTILEGGVPDSGAPQSLTDLTDVSGTPGPGKSPVGDPTGSEFTLTEIPTQADIEAILVGVAKVEWRPLVLQNGMTNSGPPYAPARYRLTLNNTVFLEGRLAKTGGLGNPDSGLVLSKLAADALPGGDLVYACPGGSNTIARVVVDAQGQLVFQGLIGGTTPVTAISLSGIVFSVGG